MATTKGFYGGGDSGSGSPSAVADKLIFSSNTMSASTTANLSVARKYPIGVSEGNTKGYWSGGDSTTFSINGIVNTGDKCTYSTDTTAAQTSANLTTSRRFGAGLTEGSTKGYFLGGVNDDDVVPPGIENTADKITFSTDTTAAQTSANLPTDYGSHATAAYGGPTKGYYYGGYSTDTSGIPPYDLALENKAYKYTFSTDSQSAQTSANLATAKIALASCSEGSTKCYIAGGDTGAIVATAEKTTFSIDTTTSQTTANLSSARYALSGTSDGGSKGFFCGGGTAGAPVVTGDVLTFSTDTTSASTSANLSLAREGAAAIGADSGGYVGSVSGITLLHIGIGL